jgi:hypothetical protein
MKKCPFCAEEIQDAAIKCRHCGSLLDQPSPLAAPVNQSAPVAASGGWYPGKGPEGPQLTQTSGHKRPLRIASGNRRWLGVAGIALGPLVGFILPQLFAFTWIAVLAGSLILLKDGALRPKVIVALILATALAAPILSRFDEKEGADRAALLAVQTQQLKQFAQANTRKNTEAAVKAFPTNKPVIRADLSALEESIGRNKWSDADTLSAKLTTELSPLLQSSIANSPDVAQLESQFKSLDLAMQKHRGAETQRTAAIQAAAQQHAAAFRAAVPSTDIAIVRHSWQKGGFDSVALWNVTLKNDSRLVTYADIEYIAVYSAASGTVLHTRPGKILDTLKPGETRSFDINDGFINHQAKRASLTITGASKKGQ